MSCFSSRSPVSPGDPTWHYAGRGIEPRIPCLILPKHEQGAGINISATLFPLSPFSTAPYRPIDANKFWGDAVALIPALCSQIPFSKAHKRLSKIGIGTNSTSVTRKLAAISALTYLAPRQAQPADNWKHSNLVGNSPIRHLIGGIYDIRQTSPKKGHPSIRTVLHLLVGKIY